MGQSAAKFSQVVRQLREDNEDLTSVEFESVHLSEKELRKLGDALRTNRYVYIYTDAFGLWYGPQFWRHESQF